MAHNLGPELGLKNILSLVNLFPFKYIFNDQVL